MTDPGPWEPASVAETAALFRGCGVPWWVAGGHAIELACGPAHPWRARLRGWPGPGTTGAPGDKRRLRDVRHGE